MGSLCVDLDSGLVGTAGRLSISLWFLQRGGLRVLRLLIWWPRSPGVSVLASKAEALWPLMSPSLTSTEVIDCSSPRPTWIPGDGA